MDQTVFREQYEQSGYVVLPGFLPDTIVDGMRVAVERMVDSMASRLLDEGTIPQTFQDDPIETRFLRVFQHDPDNASIQFSEELRVDAFFDLITYPDLLDLAGAVLGHEIRLAPGYFARPKAFPNKRFQSFWHQDPAYLLLGNQGFPRSAFDDIRIMNVWTPLVPVDRNNGCMQFLPGTHRDGMANHVPLPPHDYLEIERPALDPCLAKGPIIDVALDPGDVVLFNTLLFHQGQDNHSDMVRWSLDFRFQDARQPTLIDREGHLLRSRVSPDSAVASRKEWQDLSPR